MAACLSANFSLPTHKRRPDYLHMPRLKVHCERQKLAPKDKYQAPNVGTFVNLSDDIEKYDISFSTAEDIDKVTALIKEYPGFESIEDVIYCLGRAHARLIVGGVIPFGVRARLCVVDDAGVNTLRLYLYNMQHITKVTGSLMDDALAISDAQERSAVYHPWMYLPEECAVKYNMAFTAGLRYVLYSTKNLRHHHLYSTLMLVYCTGERE